MSVRVRLLYDPDTSAVWVGEDGPMSSGDEVVLTGSEGWQIGSSVNEEDGMHDFAFSWERSYGCPAQVSFWAASMSPLTSEHIEPLDHRGQTTWLAGLFRPLRTAPAPSMWLNQAPPQAACQRFWPGAETWTKRVVSAPRCPQHSGDRCT